MSQSTNTVIMVKPISFAMNEQTIVNNYFQQKDIHGNAASLALYEFDQMVESLKKCGIDVWVMENDHPMETPDAVFPNNWFTLHDDLLVLYPMFAPNRRLERISNFTEKLSLRGICVQNVLDLTVHEQAGEFLEGTGSLVLDRTNHRAFAAISERTHPDLVDLWGEKMHFQTVTFHAYQEPENRDKPIYHTNVVMSVGTEIAIVCLECIPDDDERKKVVEALSSHEIMEISLGQMNDFAGNMLELRTVEGQKRLVMSHTAWSSLRNEQREFLEQRILPLVVNIPTIEKIGGGSARCMIAEVFGLFSHAAKA
jgi:hypothetical protein